MQVPLRERIFVSSKFDFVVSKFNCYNVMKIVYSTKKYH